MPDRADDPVSSSRLAHRARSDTVPPRTGYTPRRMTPDTIKLAADMGTALGGAAAFIGVIFGWLGFRAWRRQKRDERRSDAAVRVYELVSRSCDALGYLAAPVFIGAPGSPAENKATASRLRLLFDERRQQVADGLRAIDEAVSIATLLLDSHHEMIVRGLLSWRDIVRRGFAICWSHVEEGDFEKAEEEATSFSWGAKVHGEIENIRRSARDALKPVAQYHANPLLSTIVAVQRRRLWTWIRRRSGR